MKTTREIEKDVEETLKQSKTTLLKEGDIIGIIGFVMLKGLENGNKYKVVRIEKRHLGNVYYFSKAKGHKVIIGHYCSDVDMSIDNRNNNRIDILKKK